MGIITEDLKRLREIEKNPEERDKQTARLDYLANKIGTHRIIGVLMEWLPTTAIWDFNDFLIDFFSMGEFKEEATQARLEKEAHPEIVPDKYFWDQEMEELGLRGDLEPETASESEIDEEAFLLSIFEKYGTN